MPTPRKDEPEDKFVSRCIPIVINEGTTDDTSQAAAVCHSIYRKHKEQNDMRVKIGFDKHRNRIVMQNDDDDDRPPTVVQTLIFNKEQFPTKESAVDWAKEHDYKYGDVDETEDSWRLRQRDPADFVEGSFRTIELTDGVQAVVGHLKEQEQSSKANKQRFRSGVSYGIEDAADGVDREQHVIRGMSIVSVGEAYGHDMEIDETFLDQTVELGNSIQKGVKARFGHPNMSSTALGTFLGRVHNFRRDDGRVRADLLIDDTAFRSPTHGDIGTYVMDLAENDPDAFGASIVFDGEDEYRLNDDGTLKKDEDGRPLLPLARMSFLYGADVVDDPATGDGMFSKTVQLSATATEQLNEFLDDPNAVRMGVAFLKRYAANSKLKATERGWRKLCEIFTEYSKQSGVSIEQSPPQPEANRMGNDTENQLNDAVVAEREELARQQEQERINTIQALGKKFGIPEEITNKMIKDNVSLENATKQLAEMDLSQLRSVEPDADVQVNAEEHDKKMNAVRDAFCVRGGVITDPKVVNEVNQNEFRGISVQNFARQCLMNAGQQDVHMLSAADLWSRLVAMTRRHFDGNVAQGTGDFSSVLSNVANKALAKGWDEAGTTYQLWTGSDGLSDFKTADIVKMTPYGDVEEIPEGEAPRMSKFDDTKEQAQLKTWGSYFTLSRQAFVNDDLRVFTRIPRAMTASYRRKINYRVYYLMFNNNGAAANFVGPTMLEDAVALFDTATHANYLALGSGGAPTEAALNAAWNAMTTQATPSPDNARSNTIYSNIKPKFILHGPHTTMAVHKLISSVYYTTSTGDPNDGYQISNIFGPGQPRNLMAVEEPLLDAFVTTVATYPWYLAADPNLNDTITVFGLNGNTAPQTKSEPSSIGEASGMKYEVMGDFVVAAIDWRGLYCNTGR
jgi:hypothetical protein